MGYTSKKSTGLTNPRLVTFYDDSEDEGNNDAKKAHNSLLDKGLARSSGNNLQDEGKDKRRRDKAKALSESRRLLPVYLGKEAILREVSENDTLIVLGETGCGKTTQIPQYLIGQDYERISSCDSKEPKLIKVVVTQPRRVAATSLAARVSEEVGCRLGTTVGYSVRFDDCSGKKTRLKYVTDGTLLQELLSDKLLSNYEIVIIDEAHERSLRTDMLMGFLKGIQAMRKEMVARNYKFPNDAPGPQAGQPARLLKIVIMSATISAQKFSEFFNNAKIIYIEGRQHPVTVYYALEPTDDYVQAAIKTCLQIHTEQPPGDVLVFLTGQEEIENMQSQLVMYANDTPPNLPQMLICPLYAKLPPNQQERVFNKTPSNTRKFIIGTNVAETSITIPGVNYVIDTGLAKVKRFHSVAGVEELRAEPISQSSAKQRSGRAGRECPGKCWRLYPERIYESLAPIQEPEIKRCSLSFAVLHLLAAGVEDIFAFKFMDKPEVDDLRFAVVHLSVLGALDKNMKISSIGRQMAKLPLEPPLARCLLASFENGCASEMIDLIALLEHSDTLLVNTTNTRDQAQERRKKFIHRDGDHLVLLNILRAYESLQESRRTAHNLQSELKEWCKEHFINSRAMKNVLESRKQLQDRCSRLSLNWRESSRENRKDISSNSEEDSAPLLCSLMIGLTTQLAVKQPDRTYINPLTKIQIKIHPSSSLHSNWVETFIYQELVHTSSTYARICSIIKPKWIDKLADLSSKK
ncbi:P-loop containing nucleoside triphosphate hydrolase protein [Phakopsora pachyrhizi]|uniref:RNA helicase n=1 Tax=Phakopsora pachyrhizi TaxID=170000 RepID=A0AAV0BIK7_PHAPC|nr:P-loop containing nucleoside triphosphate hydrolase protein [Phakopsora pachyrhizi]CAH7687057.1 P-loop containing nucleoside triphosphate hydrolase protein [Phakopsora pachyrhizi]